MRESDTVGNRLDWYNDAKLGMFIHWGPYSVAGVEASWPIMVPEWAWLGGSPRISQKAYEALPQRFDPTDFDAEAWVRAASNAGMRYIVFTSKHHDGYCMFDAPGTDYKITNSSFGRDIVAELADACRKHKMRFGLYYSPPDLHHPGYRDTRVLARTNWQGQPERPEWGTYLDYMEGHLRKLLTAYGHICVVWFDGLFDQQKYDPDRFHRLIKELSPDTLINDRLGGNGDYITPEQGIPDGVPVKEKADFKPTEFEADLFDRFMRALRTPILRRIIRRKIRKAAEEQRPLSPVATEILPPKENFLRWETCMTMNRTWGFCPTDKAWKSGSVLVHSLAKVVSKGGNFLLNVGPKPDGTLPSEALDRLAEVGRWIEACGESIYGSSYGPIQGNSVVTTTEKDGVLYAIFLGKTDSASVRLSPGRSVSSITNLATKDVVAFRRIEDDIEIDISREVTGGISQPVVLRLE
jgi:alpha-L-fucosidase